MGGSQLWVGNVTLLIHGCTETGRCCASISGCVELVTYSSTKLIWRGLMHCIVGVIQLVAPTNYGVIEQTTQRK